MRPRFQYTNTNSGFERGITMEIIRQYGIEDKRDLYNLSEAPGLSMQKMVGQRVEVKGYLLTSDVDKKTGEIVKILKVMDRDGNICGTGSKPFIEGFEKFLLFMGTDEIDSFAIGEKNVISSSVIR